MRFSARHRLVALACLAGLASGPLPATAWADPDPSPTPAQTAASDSVGVPATPAETEALTQARKTGQPVTVDASTTETSLVQARPDGTLQATITPAPQRVRRNGSWSPTDQTLTSQGGRLVPRSAAVDTSLGAGGGTVLARVADEDDHWFQLNWPEQLPAPVVAGDTAVYRDVAPGIDLVARATDSGFSTYLVIASASAASSPILKNLSYTWSASPGLSVTASQTGLRVVDSDGALVFTAPGLAMWDASDVPAADRQDPAAVTATGGDSNRRQIDAHVEGQRLALDIDTAMLTSPDTVYPVVVDPAMTIAQSSWTMVWNNGQSFWGSSEEARVGYDGWTDNKISRAYYTFNLSGLKGRIIKSATLVHRNTYSPNWDCNLTSYGAGVQAWTTNPISSATTWSNQPAARIQQGTSTVAHGHSESCPGYSRAEWDVTQGVQGYQTTGAMTIMLRSANESDRDGWRRYANIKGSMPAVTVTYYVTPNTPARANVSPLYNSTPFTSAKTLTLSAAISSADTTDSKLFAKFGVSPYGSGNWTTFNSGYITGSGTVNASWKPPAEGGYSYRVQACSNSGGGCSAWSGSYAVTADWTAPATPTISGEPNPVANVATNYTIKSNSSDVINYLWGTTPSPGTSVAGGAAGITVPLQLPLAPATLRAIAVDRAGNHSSTAAFDLKPINGSVLTHQYLLNNTGSDTGGSAIDLNLAVNGTGTNLWAAGAQPTNCTVAAGQSFRAGGQSVRLLNGDGTGLSSTTAFTVTAWIKPEAADLSAGEHFAVWYTRPGGRAFMISIKDVHWAGSVGTASAPNIIGPAIDESDLNVWHHIGLTYNGDLQTGIADLYIDGQRYSYQTSEPDNPTITPIQGVTLGIGYGGTPWTGAIDNVRILTGYTNQSTMRTDATTCP